MPLRRLLHENPALTTAVYIGLLLLALGLVAYYLWTRSPQRLAPPSQEQPVTQRHASAAGEGCPAFDAATAAAPQ